MVSGSNSRRRGGSLSKELKSSLSLAPSPNLISRVKKERIQPLNPFLSPIGSLFAKSDSGTRIPFLGADIPCKPAGMGVYCLSFTSLSGIGEVAKATSCNFLSSFASVLLPLLSLSSCYHSEEAELVVHNARIHPSNQRR